MARATNGLGQFRGKVGSVVFRVSQGQQIASAYQPAVKNPKSNLQTAQRNKMYLASQLSKLVPREDIIGLAPNASARDRRSYFIRNIINNTSSTLENELFSSSISCRKVLFSNGIDYDGISSVSVVAETGEVTITIDKNVVTEDAFNRLAIKLIQITVVNGVASEYKSSWLELGTYDNSPETTFDIKTSVNALPATTYLYLIPVMVADGVRYSSELKSLIQTDMGNYVITGEYAINNAVLKWYKSMSAGPIGTEIDQPIVPPTGSEDEVVNPNAPNFPNLG